MSDKKTRDYIIEAADRLVYRQGFEHTSFTDIADAVGISRGNFYYHFKSRDDADRLAMHVLAWSQGVATLASTFHDVTFVKREGTMFVILLRFSDNRDRAGQFMAGHNDWNLSQNPA